MKPPRRWRLVCFIDGLFARLHRQQPPVQNAPPCLALISESGLGDAIMLGFAVRALLDAHPTVIVHVVVPLIRKRHSLADIKPFLIAEPAHATRVILHGYWRKKLLLSHTNVVGALRARWRLLRALAAAKVETVVLARPMRNPVLGESLALAIGARIVAARPGAWESELANSRQHNEIQRHWRSMRFPPKLVSAFELRMAGYFPQEPDVHVAEQYMRALSHFLLRLGYPALAPPHPLGEQHNGEIVWCAFATADPVRQFVLWRPLVIELRRRGVDARPLPKLARFAEIIPMLHASRALIGSDSAPAHAAVACGTPLCVIANEDQPPGLHFPYPAAFTAGRTSAHVSLAPAWFGEEEIFFAEEPSVQACVEKVSEQIMQWLM